MSTKENPVIVGIGASAGGLEAIQDFFKNVPPDSGMAYVVVQHLSPDYKSMMDELLSRYTKLRIVKVEDGTEVHPNTIYLIPPRKNMYIYHNKLFLEDQDLKRGLNLPIDIFFRSLATDKGNRAIGVILSGTGSDGTLGIKAIKEAGGMVMVQEPESAKFDGMPLSSISTGMVDYILPVWQMPQEIINFVNHPFVDKKDSLKKQLNENIDTLSKILLILRDFSGVDFSYYKENTIFRRLERRLSINRMQSLDEYFKFLLESNKEKEILYRELLIGVTRFFRDSEAFDVLSSKVFPEILRKNHKRQIRLWSVGCSTGEEVYSVAILLQEFLERHNLRAEYKIFATDIDKNAIDFASMGVYPDNISADVSSDLLQKYFTRKENNYIIKENIRKNIVFARHNVLKDPPFSKIDLIICRNLFIYFKPDVQAKVLSTFYFSMVEDGFLFLGSSESIGDMQDAFEIFDAKHKFYRYVKGYKNRVVGNLPLPELKVARNETVKPIPHNIKYNIDFLTERMLNLYAPPSIIVDTNNNLIISINDVNDFIRVPSGKFTNDIFQLLIEDLRPTIRALIRKLSSDKKALKYENVKCKIDEKDKYIDIEGRIIENAKDNSIFYQMSFIAKENQQIDKQDIEVIDYPNQYHEKILELEKDLQYTKESLQSTIEELETTNEELQSSNEELIASNEELQSTNEELQSVNEELYTINAEYQAKIEELITLNNDINNLLKNTNIGTLYLDINLCIRKFTPLIGKIFKLRESDIGRPIIHFNFNNIIPGFIDNVNFVLDSLSQFENEIFYEQKIWYLVRVMPYRNTDNAVEGIIVTLTDITQLKNTMFEKEKISERLSIAMDMGNIAWWEWDITTNLVEFHPKKATMIGYSVEEFPKNVYEICSLIHPDDYEKTMNEMREYLKGNRPIYDVKYRIRRKDGKYSWYYDRGGITQCDSTGKPIKLAGIVIDISDIKEMEDTIRKNNELIKIVLENSPIGKVLVDKNGKIVYVNPAAERVLNASRDEILLKQYDADFWNIEDIDGNPIPSEELPFSRVINTKTDIKNYRHFINVNGKKILLDISGTPIIDSAGQITSALFVVQSVDF